MEDSDAQISFPNRSNVNLATNLLVLILTLILLIWGTKKTAAKRNPTSGRSGTRKSKEVAPRRMKTKSLIKRWQRVYNIIVYRIRSVRTSQKKRKVRSCHEGHQTRGSGLGLRVQGGSRGLPATSTPGVYENQLQHQIEQCDPRL